MIPLIYSLSMATTLFILGLFGVMIRRNFFFLLLNLIVMMNGSILALVIAGYHWHQFDGQIISILAISAAIAEACIGLALLLQLYTHRKTINLDSLSEMKG